jgi:hypothetical protein
LLEQTFSNQLSQIQTDNYLKGQLILELSLSHLVLIGLIFIWSGFVRSGFAFVVAG